MPRRILDNPPTEKAVYRLLASKKPEDDATLRHWLAQPPPAATTSIVSLVARVAKGAKNTQSRWREFGEYYALTFNLTFIMFLAFFLVGNQSKFAALGMCFAQVVSVPLLFWNGINRARVAERAAFLLAEVGDERAITCLANLWTPHPRGKQDAAVNARAGAELMRWIAAQNGNRFDMTTEDALRRVITRSFPQGRWARTRQRLRPPPDLTEADLDLLLSIVRYLSSLPTAKASASPTADVAALWQVASSSRAGTHYDLLRDTTQVLILQHAQKETPCRKAS